MKSLVKDTIRVSVGITLSMAVLTAALAVSQNAMAIVPEQPYVHNTNDDPTDFRPVASFRVWTNAGMGREAEGTMGTKFYFDARNSKDPERGQLKYRWDFDGDGQAETDWFTEPTAERVYWETGQKTIKLIVRDEVGNLDHTTHQIKIVKNTRPTAFFTVEPETGSPAQKFRFNAAETFDDQYKQGRLFYRWDFDGDKVYDTDWSPREIVEHTYGHGYKGIQKVTLEVKDPENGRHTFTKDIEILENTVPVAVVEVEPKVGTFDTLFRLNAENSFDDETEHRDLKFRWDMDYNGPNDIIYDSAFSKGYSRSIRFDDDNQKVGTQRVRVEIQDEDGEIGTAIAYTVLHWASPYLKELNDEGIIYTRHDRTFDPNTPVPRGEVIQMIIKKLDLGRIAPEYQPIFSDIPQHDKYMKYVLEAYNRGIVEGYPDGTFRPEASISRAETLAMILRAFEIDILRGGFQFYPDVPKSEWFFKFVDTGTTSELVSGYDTGSFGPHDPITFGEIAKMLYQADKLDELN
ncbi:hypothetical protein HOG48_04690 [Candidatus Peregrinibacteria bacterium]|nr:hypothetical protein [Candidatus Peregrinibacteria bacterium]